MIFCRHLGECSTEQALLFRKLDFFMVGVLVFTKQWGVLARHLVVVSSHHYHACNKDNSEKHLLEAMLRERLRPIVRVSTEL